MQLTSHTDYSLRLLIYLVVRSDLMPPTVQAASSRYGISAHHVAKVAQTLVQLGYVNSRRGRGGGLELAKPPEKINLGALVRQTENLTLLECFGTDSKCVIDPACRLKGVLGQAQSAFLNVLDGYTLADLVGNAEALQRLLTQQAGAA